MDPIRDLHTGQRRVKAVSNRPDTQKHLNLRAQLLRKLLHPTGVRTRIFLFPSIPAAAERSLQLTIFPNRKAPAR